MDFCYSIVAVAKAGEIIMANVRKPIRGSRLLRTSTTWCMATSATTWSGARA